MRLCFCIKYTLLLLLHNIYVVLTVNGFGCTLHERNLTHDTVPVPASERNTQIIESCTFVNSTLFGCIKIS